MEKFKQTLKAIFSFIFMLSAISQIHYFITAEILRRLMKKWVQSDTFEGFPKICYLSILAYLIISIVIYLLHNFLYKDKKIFVMSVICIILLFLNSMFGTFGCFRVKFH